MNGGLIMNKPKGKNRARDIFDINSGDTLIISGDEKQGIAIPPKNAFTKLVTTIFYGTMPQRADEE